MSFFLTKKYGIYLFFGTITLLFLISLYQRVPNEDEAIIAEHGFYLNQLGYVKSDLYAGYGYGWNWEDRQLYYHKFFVLAGSFLSSIFGFHIYTFKTVSLLFAFIFFFYFYKYIKEFEKKQDTTIYFLFATALLLSNYLFFNHSFM